MSEQVTVNVNVNNAAPVTQLKTNRSMLKLVLLGIVTLGIYPLVIYCGISTDINLIASRYDGKKTMHYALLAFVIAPITFGIGYLVWSHNISARMGAELARRGISYSFGASDFWLWNVLGSFIIVGPFIYMHKLCSAINLLAADFNEKG